MKKLILVFLISVFSFYCNTGKNSDNKDVFTALFAIAAGSSGGGVTGNGFSGNADSATTTPSSGNGGVTGSHPTGTEGTIPVVTTPPSSDNGGTSDTSGNSGGTTGNAAATINLTSNLQKTQVGDHYTVYQALGTGSGTLVQFAGHEHETDPNKITVQPVFQSIWDRLKNKYGKCIYVGLSAGQKVKPRYNEMRTYIFNNVVGSISIVDLSAGSLYGEFLQEDAQARGYSVIRVDIAGISKGIIFKGFAELLNYLSLLLGQFIGANSIPPDWEDYLPESDLIAEVQGLRKKNAGVKNFCIAMDAFNSGNDTLTSIESACSEIAPANQIILAGYHDVNVSFGSIRSVTETVAYILENEKSPDKQSYPLPVSWNSGLSAMIPVLLPALDGVSIQPTSEGGVPGVKANYNYAPWKVDFSAKVTNINLAKNLVEMSGDVVVSNTAENKKIIAQNLVGEVVYNKENYAKAGGTPRISGFENYAYYFRGTAKTTQQCYEFGFVRWCLALYEQVPLTYIDVMEVKAPVYIVSATLGIQDNKNFRIGVDISGHWQKDENFLFVPIHRTIDVSSPGLGIAYTNGYPSITGVLSIRGYGLGLDDITTTCTFFEKERTADYVVFTSPQTIKANILGITIGESSCSAMVGGDIKLPIIK
ncbi:MAG: hypothetical protein KBF93_14410 [Leptospiraceae bacterium]|nr:hypothetical protein [Leptospiraceae bacterium]